MSEVTERRVHACRRRCPSSCRLGRWLVLLVWQHSALSADSRRSDFWWCLDSAAGPQESSTSEVQRLQKFCRRNCWVFAASRKSEVSWSQRAPSVVGHEAIIFFEVERRLLGQRLANQTCHFELDTLSMGSSHRSSQGTGVMWSRRRVPVISRAVAFCTDCSLRSKVSGKP